MSVIPLQHRLKVHSSPVNLALKQAMCDLRVACPAIIVANQDGNPFNQDQQTISVQPAVIEVMNQNGVPTLVTLPILDDVPFQIPRAGGWSLTMPPAVGDEVLLVFSDSAFDHWWQSGGVQKQPDGKLYRHDIGDAMAILGISSVPRILADYSTTSAQLRSDDGETVIDLAMGEIKLWAASVRAQSSESGTALALATVDLVTWITTNVLPILPPGTPPPPVSSVTTILKGE